MSVNCIHLCFFYGKILRLRKTTEVNFIGILIKDLVHKATCHENLGIFVVYSPTFASWIAVQKLIQHNEYTLGVYFQTVMTKSCILDPNATMGSFPCFMELNAWIAFDISSSLPP